MALHTRLHISGLFPDDMHHAALRTRLSNNVQPMRSQTVAAHLAAERGHERRLASVGVADKRGRREAVAPAAAARTAPAHAHRLQLALDLCNLHGSKAVIVRAHTSARHTFAVCTRTCAGSSALVESLARSGPIDARVTCKPRRRAQSHCAHHHQQLTILLMMTRRARKPGLAKTQDTICSTACPPQHLTQCHASTSHHHQSWHQLLWCNDLGRSVASAEVLCIASQLRPATGARAARLSRDVGAPPRGLGLADAGDRAAAGARAAPRSLAALRHDLRLGARDAKD
jgi:hypothetical protein